MGASNFHPVSRDVLPTISLYLLIVRWWSGTYRTDNLMTEGYDIQTSHMAIYIYKLYIYKMVVPCYSYSVAMLYHGDSHLLLLPHLKHVIAKFILCHRHDNTALIRIFCGPGTRKVMQDFELEAMHRLSINGRLAPTEERMNGLI